MSKRILSIVLLAVGIILACVLACYISNKSGYKHGWDAALSNVKPDTEWVEKTVYKDSLVPVEVNPAGKELYPVGTVAELKRVIDSLASVKPDTSFVEIPIPIETKLFRDEEDSTFEAQVSGYHPNLDWIRIHKKTAYITNTVVQKEPYKEAMSAYVDAGASFNQFYVKAGLVYEQQLFGPVYWNAKAGYEWTNIGKGGFMEVGARLEIWHK